MIAGLTGHQKIGDQETVRWVEKELLNLLVSEKISEGWMSLAVGADQMYAKFLLRLGLPYRVVIPCKRYEETFSEAERQTYRYFLSRASSIVNLEFVEPTGTAFFEAGKEVVRRSEVLIAVWDGLAAKGLGGTADVVHFAQSNSRHVFHVNTLARTVEII